MMKMKQSLILMVVLFVAAPVAWAEDDPVAPPSSETPKAPPAKAPPAKAPPVKAETPDAPTAPAAEPTAPEWSPPSTAARRELPADNLPSPLVRDPRTGARLAGTAPARPTAPSSAATDPLLGTGTPSAPPRDMPTVTTTPMVMAGAQIESIAKVHNLPLPDKKLALRLDVTFAIQGERGRAVYLEVDFQRVDTGEIVRSTLPVYAGPDGALGVRTALSTVPVDAGRYAANVWVPYQAFPSPTDASMYTVQATVKLQRSEANRAATTLTSATTTFNVHAPAPAAAPALPDTRDLLPKPQDIPAPGDGPLDIDDAPVEIDDPFAPPVAAGSPEGE